MGRARVVAPPPKDYVPEPLVAPPIDAVTEDIIINDWKESNLIEEIVAEVPSAEEIEKDRIAQQRYEELQLKKKEEAERQAKIEEDKRIALEEAEKAKRLLEEEKDRLAAITHTQLQQKKENESREKLSKKDKKELKKDPELVAELEILRQANEKLTREKEAAEKAREETILAMRNKATEQKGNQLNIVKQRKPSLWNRLKTLFRRRRIELATVGIKNYETAILQRARIAVPKMLDDLEKMHEQLTILEELIAKYVERQKIKDR